MSQDSFMQEMFPPPPPMAPVPGRPFWVEVTSNEHRVFDKGTKFFVIFEGEHFLTCWHWGDPPAHPNTVGTILGKRYVEVCENPAGHERAMEAYRKRGLEL